MNLLELRYRIERSWSRLTTYCPENWSEQNKAYGQCAVSSLLVHQILNTTQEYKDFKLVKCLVNDVLHYFNIINGIPFDVSYCQFPSASVFTDIKECDEKELLDEIWKINCYTELKKNFHNSLDCRLSNAIAESLG